ncbi:hypothetical protein SO802_025542 [Lithocarpus litseifolius]|uniref:RNase H type-1 domain-containing protein n=1 Tax=Lithocarpus litseifolius TaxID=425828 RepID=A0AAW2BZL8_9ROSI
MEIEHNVWDPKSILNNNLQSSLIARIYKAKYFPYCDILGAKLGCNPSYAWRSIYNSLEVIKRGIRWRVRNGKMIHIWEDKWLPTPITHKVCSPQQDIGDFPMVSSLINEEIRHWKVDKVKRHFLPFEAETILNIPLSYNLLEDSIIWMGNKQGVFSVKSAYYVALPFVEKSKVGECSIGDSRTRLWKKVWQLQLPAKEDYKNAIVYNHVKQQSPDVGWAAPPPKTYKINVDGATAGALGKSSVGVVIQDSGGMVEAAACKVLNGDYDAAVTKAFAVDEGIWLAKEMELH